jgi:metal-responsive CopG/Arc/MetJ family transcriptional regulator
MAAISLKLEQSMLDTIDSTLKEHNFSTRTEFIRGAIRLQLDALRRERLAQEFLALQGTAKKHSSDKKRHQDAKDALRALIKESGWSR